MPGTRRGAGGLLARRVALPRKKHWRARPGAVVYGRVVHVQELRQRSARGAGAGDPLSEGPCLSAAGLSLHVGAQTWPGPRVLHVHGAPRGHVDQPVLSGHRPGRTRMGAGTIRCRRYGQYRRGDAKGEPVKKLMQEGSAQVRVVCVPVRLFLSNLGRAAEECKLRAPPRYPLNRTPHLRKEKSWQTIDLFHGANSSRPAR
ncbi:hypothetical protein SBA2_810034 [Acidobacteriia bacterium SbA2]|nr:hypothetical protein SBA2_810034 [Acidobacteriia bacterium SbA2]